MGVEPKMGPPPLPQQLLCMLSLLLTVSVSALMGVEPKMGPPPPLQQLLCMLSLLLTVSVSALSSSNKPLQPLTLMKKSAAAISADYPDYQIGVKYDEYPGGEEFNK
ncbi:hypothetical protein J6590_065367 [Homalodisca vitripennis]|nr:hypothetical protein J6590_065367 [Homalodisca vitripennis]